MPSGVPEASAFASWEEHAAPAAADHPKPGLADASALNRRGGESRAAGSGRERERGTSLVVSGGRPVTRTAVSHSVFPASFLVRVNALLAAQKKKKTSPMNSGGARAHGGGGSRDAAALWRERSRERERERERDRAAGSSSAGQDQEREVPEIHRATWDAPRECSLRLATIYLAAVMTFGRCLSGRGPCHEPRAARPSTRP